MSISRTFDNVIMYNTMQYTEFQRLQAAKWIATMAKDVEDCRLLLDALGLLDDLQDLRTGS